MRGQQCLKGKQAVRHAEPYYWAIFRLHTYLWSVQVHVVGGTDQGVPQLQQEFSPDFQTQTPLTSPCLCPIVLAGFGGKQQV